MRIALVSATLAVAAVLAPWPWLTVLLALSGLAVLALGLIALLTDEHLVVRSGSRAGADRTSHRATH